jgi:hypothetical protein
MWWIIGGIVLAVIIWFVPVDGPDDFKNDWPDSTLYCD